MIVWCRPCLAASSASVRSLQIASSTPSVATLPSSSIQEPFIVIFLLSEFQDVPLEGSVYPRNGEGFILYVTAEYDTKGIGY